MYASFIALVIYGKNVFGCGVILGQACENTTTSCKMKLYSKMYPKLQDTSTIKQINRHIFMYRHKQLLI